jgi:hypothetical protein
MATRFSWRKSEARAAGYIGRIFRRLTQFSFESVAAVLLHALNEKSGREVFVHRKYEGNATIEIGYFSVQLLPRRVVTRPGDVWHLGDHRVSCGDSTSAVDVELVRDRSR